MAKDLTAQLTIAADATGVEGGIGRAKKSLADLGVVAEAAGKRASGGLDSIGQGGDAAAKKVDSATKGLVNSIQRTIAQLEAGSRSGSKFYETLANQRGVSLDALRPYLDQLDLVAAKQAQVSKGIKPAAIPTLTTSLGATNFSKPLDGIGTSRGATAFGEIAREATKVSEALAKGGIQFNQYGLSAKQTAAALRQVPAQLTDIFVGLQGGQAPLTVLLQQGGQLKDVFGGIAPAARALGGAVLGLINPFTIAAAAAVALALAYKAGSAEADAYAKALILSGNAAGANVGDLREMAKGIAAVTGTQRAAADALAQFAATGDVTSASLQRVAQAAIKLERGGGQAVAETVKQFSALAKEPLAASIKINESLRHLTRSTYEQIKALDEQGRTTEAATIAQRAYAEVIEQRGDALIGRLGLIERAWDKIKNATLGAVDAALNIGRISTAQEQLAAAQQKLVDLEARGAVGARGGRRQSTTAAEIAAEKSRIEILNQQIGAERSIADAAAKTAAQVKARTEFDKEGIKFLTDKAKLERAIAEARGQGAAAGASAKEIAAREADIRASFAKKVPKGPKDEDPGKNDLAAQIGVTKNLLDQEIGAFRNAESILEAIRSAGLISESDYYESKRGFLNLNVDAQERQVQSEIAALEVENERIAGQKGKQREIIDNNRKIADAETRLAVIRADASAKTEISAIQQAAALKRVELGYLSARQAAQDFFDTTSRQQQRSLDGVGKGTQRRDFDQGVSQVEDRFADQRRDLENQKAQLELEGKFTEEAKKQYDARLNIINEFQGKSIASFTDYYAKLVDKQRDFANGATEALANYLSDVADVAKQTESLFTKAFSGIEDALVEFAKTGKLNFSQFAQQIGADLLRITVRQNITGPLAAGLQGGFQTGEGAGGVLKSILGPLLGNRNPITSVPGTVGGTIDLGAASAAATAQATATAAITAAQASSSAAIVAALTTGSTAATASASAAATANTAAHALTATTITTAIAASTTAIVSAIASASVASSGGASSLGGLGNLFSAGVGGFSMGGDIAASAGDVYDIASLFAGFAKGGRPPVGQPVWVGEQGREIFVPDVAGRILSATESKSAVGGGGSGSPNMVTNVKVNVIGAPSQPQVRQRQTGSDVEIDMIFEQFESRMSERIGNGGGVLPAITQRTGLNGGAGLMR